MSIIDNQVDFPTIDKKDPISGATISYPAYNTFMSGSQSVSRVFQPVGTVSGIGQSVTLVDFVVQNQTEVHAFQNLVLAINITNNSANTVNMLGSPYLFQTVQQLVNNAPVETVYPNYLTSLYYSTYSNMQLQTLAPLMMMPSNTSVAYSPFPIAPGASVVALLPLDDLTFLTQGVLLNQMRTEYRFRFNFSSANTWVTTASIPDSGDLVVNNVQLYARGLIYTPNKLQELVSKWGQSTHVFPKVIPTLKQIQIGGILNTTLSGKQTLNCVSGNYMGIIAQSFDTQGATNESYLTPRKLTTLQFLYNDGSQINYLNTDELIRYDAMSQFPNTQMFSEGSAGAGWLSRSYFVPLCSKLLNCLVQSGSCGGINFSGFESVQIQPSTTQTNGRLDLYMLQAGVYAILPLSGITTFTLFVSQSA